MCFPRQVQKYSAGLPSLKTQSQIGTRLEPCDGTIDYPYLISQGYGSNVHRSCHRFVGMIIPKSGKLSRITEGSDYFLRNKLRRSITTTFLWRQWGRYGDSTKRNRDRLIALLGSITADPKRRCSIVYSVVRPESRILEVTSHLGFRCAPQNGGSRDGSKLCGRKFQYNLLPLSHLRYPQVAI